MYVCMCVCNFVPLYKTFTCVLYRVKYPVGGGGVLPYISHGYHKGYVFLRRFGLKMGIDFTHFSLESGIMFSRELRECMNVLIVSTPISVLI